MAAPGDPADDGTGRRERGDAEPGQRRGPHQDHRSERQAGLRLAGPHEVVQVVPGHAGLDHGRGQEHARGASDPISSGRDGDTEEGGHPRREQGPDEHAEPPVHLRSDDLAHLPVPGGEDEEEPEVGRRLHDREP